MAALPGRTICPRISGVVVALGLLAGCSHELQLDVQLVTSSCAARPELDPMTDATQLAITVYGPDVDPVATQVKVARSDGTASLSIPPGKNRRLVVEALKGPDGGVVARGDSGLLDLSVLSDGPVPVSVFLRRVDAFTPAAAAEAPGTCSELVRARAGHTATVLEDGRVLIAGGYTEDGSTRLYEQSTEIYDPRTGVFSPGPDMGLQRAFHTSTHAPHTSLTVVAGGQFGTSGPGAAVRVAEIFDETTRHFTVVPMIDARTHHAAAASTSSGRVLLMGGYGLNGVALDTTEVYDPTRNTFLVGPKLPAHRAEAVAVPLARGGIFLIGGFDGSSPIGRAELLQPVSGGNYAIPPDVDVHLQEPRNFPMAALLDGDRVLVAGGFSDHGRSDPYVSASGSLETVAAAGSVGEKAASLKSRRGDGGAVGLPDGTVLVGGGAFTDSSGKLTMPLDGEIVTRADDGTLAARLTASGLRDGRMQATWTLLQDGTVLVTGGYTVDKATGKHVFLRSAEIFQPRYVGSKASPFR